MPIGAETFVSAALQPLFDRLFSLSEHLLMKLRNSGDLAEKLIEWKAELEMIEAVLSDAEHKQFQSNKAVKKWVDDLQGLALDMEDLLEDFAIELQRQELNANMDQHEDAHQLDSDRHSHPVASVFGASVPVPANMVTSMLNNLSTMFDRIDADIQRKMEVIIGRLQAIHSRAKKLGLSAESIMQLPTLQSEALKDKPESSSLVSEVFGRDDKKQDIISRLLEGDHGAKNYVVIPIVGMGGIGKTTLAQYAYNNEQVKGHFDLMAWVCVSDVFEVKRITTAIFKLAVCRGTAVEFSTLDEAQTELKQVLTSRKFLIVLDDIWNEEYDAWDQLQEPFQPAAKGSRVIMTTRNQEIARMMNTDPSHNNIINLQGLSDDDCWRVFQHHANSDSDLDELRDAIIKKCQGLPLAAKALGGLLKRTVDKKKRRMILGSSPWSKESGVSPVLRLSYHYLPSHLKRMFAYCSVLCKDYEFTRMEIILLWMAQGFLPENEEDVGHIYFDDLRSRSLFEPIPYSNGMFIMHDLIHDLALWAAGRICYVMGIDDLTQIDNWKRIRHVFFTEDGRTTLESQLTMASQLRTFYCDRHRRIENLNITKGFRYIRTLRLASDTIEVLPECIGGLKHLRFLRLCFERIKELPMSIDNLWNLQTLWLEFCYNLEKVPHIGNLKHLCFFSLEFARCIKELPNSINHFWNLQTLCLANCSGLQKIPEISSLEKLRHLEIEITSLEEMPMGFEKLTNLQSLDKFVLGHGRGARIRELKDLNQLKGELKICGLENVSTVENAKEAQLHKKCGLDNLFLEWGTGIDEVYDNTKREVVEKLKPHSSIKKCVLNGYRGLAFPTWLGDPCFNNMVEIRLIHCDKCECLPPLGQLPQLEYVLIKGMDGIVQIGPEFYGNLRCSNPFPTLKSLHFKNMYSWERWLDVDNEANNPFPCLESLEIYGCDSLQGDVPPHLPSLKRLDILGCKALSVSIPLQSLPSLEKLRVHVCKIQLITTEGALQEEHGLSPSPKGTTPCELPHLTTLTIASSPSLISFREGLLLPSLEQLDIINCENMESLPSEMHKYTSLQSLCVEDSPKIQCFPEGGLPKNLKKLEIRKLNIKRVHSLPSSLSKLYINDFPSLKSISCSNLPNLIKIDIMGCPELESIEDDALPPQLHSLCIEKCPKLQFFLQGGLPNNLKSLTIIHVKLNQAIQAWGLHRLHSVQIFTLKEVDTEEDLSLSSSMFGLYIEGNQNVKNLSIVDGTTTLTQLSVKDCPKLEFVFGNFTSLVLDLSLWSCPKLQSLPGDRLPLNLTFLSIRDGVGIEKPIREWGLHLLTSLKHLELHNVGRCTDAVERIPGPDDLQLPSSLSRLEVGGFQNLTSISCSTLHILTHLFIEHCPQLESIANNALPPQLYYVSISECDLIKPHLVRDPHGVIRMDGDTWSLR